jgi:dual specificity protein kinase YAK1
MRPQHQHQLSGGRLTNLHAGQEPSAAAQRYSPMEVLSPSSPYASKSGGGAGQFSQSPSQRQSPSRPSDYSQQSPLTYYNSRQAAPQLPPINPYASGQEGYQSAAVAAMDGAYMDPKSPRLPPQSALPLNDKGPVPEFKKIRASTDLMPKVNSQPAFRRANPEGGFISVSLRLKPFRLCSSLFTN